MGKSDKQPKVWICNSRTTGDYNNGLAVVKALNGDNYRIFESYDWKKNDDGTFKVVFKDERHSHEYSSELVKPENFPDVLIDSSDHHNLFQLPRSFEDFRADSPFAHTLIIGIDPPDMSIFTDPGVPRKKQADINIVFTHQISNDVNLTANMRAFDLVPSRVNQTILKDNLEAGENFISEFELKHPVHTVIVGYEGGHTIDEHISDLKSLAEKTISSIKKTAGSVIVATSPRTPNPETVFDIFNKAAEGTNIKICLDKYDSDPQKNNYLKILSAADKIIFTGDSISMSSDAVATGKPTYLFNWTNNPHTSNDITTSSKYNNTLIERGYIMPISKLSEPAPAINHLNSAEDIAKLISDELNIRKKPRTTIAGDLVRPASKALAQQLDKFGKFLGINQL